MKFINKTNNTINLQDVSMEIPFLGDKEQEIDIDVVKRSKSFRRLVSLGMIYITIHENSHLEQILMRLQSTYSNKDTQVPVINNVPSNKLQVLIRGHFYDAGGYAKANKNLAISLSRAGVDVGIEPINSSHNDLTELDMVPLIPLLKKQHHCIVIDSTIPTYKNKRDGKYNILYTTIESGSIPDIFVENVNSYDEVWVVSEFCKKVLKKYDISIPIFVLPNSIDIDLYKMPLKPHQIIPEPRSFVFLSVGAWTYRKGFKSLLNAFIREFNSNDDVSLLIMSRDISPADGVDRIKEDINGVISACGKTNYPHICRYSGVIPEYLMPSIYRACNAFVLFSRGEGFCTPMIEAAVCDLPVIGVNYSGPTMFLNKDNSFLVDPDNIITTLQGSTGTYFWDNQLFASLESEDFITSAGKIMRYVYEHQDEAKEKNDKLKSFIADDYNMATVSYCAKKRLEEIYGNLRGRS